MLCEGSSGDVAQRVLLISFVNMNMYSQLIQLIWSLGQVQKNNTMVNGVLVIFMLLEFNIKANFS